MTFEEIIKELKHKRYRPLYFLHGDEPYYIDALSDYIEENALSESEKAFNQTIVYGKEAEAKTLIDTAGRYPMMSSHQVVILKEAQDMRTLKDLQPYFQHLIPTTIFVVCYKHKKFDKRSKLAKSIKDPAILFESKKLYDNQVPGWIESYLKKKHLRVDPAATQLIAEYLGTNLGKIANELDKLALNLAEGVTVTSNEVQEHIGISKDYNVFELQNALGTKQSAKVFRIVQYFAANPKSNPFVVVVSALYNYFSKVYMLQFLRHSGEQDMLKALKLRSAFFLKQYRAALKHYNRAQTEHVLHLLKEYDLKSKGVNNVSTDQYELLRELMIKILSYDQR